MFFRKASKNKVSKDSSIKIYSDGGARGNPGPAACAFVVIRSGELIYQESKFLGHATNNVAEYGGVLLALEWSKRNVEEKKFTSVKFFLDSQLVARQLNGEYKVKNEALKKYVIKIKSLEKAISADISYVSIPREKNKLPDELLNKRIDENL